MNSYFIPIPRFTQESHRLFLNYRAGKIANLVGQIKELVEWSKKEHDAAIQYSIRKGDFRTVTYLSNEFSFVRILAISEVFVEVCNLLAKDEEVWNALDIRTRRNVANAYEFAHKSGLV